MLLCSEVELEGVIKMLFSQSYSQAAILGTPRTGKTTLSLTIIHAPDVVEQSGMERNHERGIGE